MAITKRQREIYDYISNFVARNGYSPSFEEIGEGMGLSSLATVHKHISNLEKKGLLKRDFNRSRSIDVLPPKGSLKKSMAPPVRSLELPLAGRIAAGRPIEAIENPETLSLADFTQSGKDVYVLKVVGESMQDEHIVEGDYVIVESTKSARNGEIVVALVEGSDATLKRIYHEGETTRLQPSNAKMQPIIVPSRAVEVQGRVIGVLRKY
jgi:repressor LexA